MKTVQHFALISLALSIAVGNTSQAAGARIVVVEAGTRNDHLRSDIIGDTMIVGANFKSAATVYVRSGKKWKKQVELLPGGAYTPVEVGQGVPAFGTSVALTAPHELANPDYAIVGAPRDKPATAGSAHIFHVTGKIWKRQAKIVPADAAKGDGFGWAVGIERNVAVVGAHLNDSSLGSAYVFVRSGTQWRQKQKLVPGDLARTNEFGRALVIHEGVIAVGAPNHTHSGVRFTGAVYVFVRDGDTWVQQTKLTAPDAASADNFGAALAMSGKTLIVGAPKVDAKGKKDSGAAYVFVRDGARWKQQAKLVSSNARKSDQFGRNVATNGNVILVGAELANEGAESSGVAYVFAREDGVWKEKEKVLPKDAGIKINFGAWVAISGNTAVISAHNALNEGPESGNGVAAYVYSTVEDFSTPPYAVEPFGLRATTLGQVKHTALLQNFPNPFNPETWLPYRLAVDAPVTLGIYNVQGQLVWELNLGAQKTGGYLTRDTAAYWDGRDQVGETVSSGVYFYTLHAGSFQGTRRMLILK